VELAIASGDRISKESAAKETGGSPSEFYGLPEYLNLKNNIPLKGWHINYGKNTRITPTKQTITVMQSLMHC
jgi:hypothetical protein